MPLMWITAKLSTASYTYNGNTPAVKVTGATNKEYKAIGLSKNVGKHTVTVTLSGSKYTGSKKLSYTIIPKKPTIKTPTKGKNYVTVKWSKMTTKMASKRITGYQVQIARDKKFTKSLKSYKVKGYSKTSKKITGRSRKTTYYVRVRTYLGSYYSGWSSVKMVKTS